MVNLLEISMWVSHGFLKLAGMKPQLVEIETGTVMHFWVPTRTRSDKPAVIFLHGFGIAGILTWLIQVLFLARSYAVYVPDFLFFGDSTTDKPDRSPEFQAECVAKSLKKLGVKKCILVGLSYGGMVGFKMAEMYPDLVKSMVISGSVMALTESISSDGLRRIGLSSWSELLIPRTLEDLRKSSEITAYKMPWHVQFISEGLLKMLSENRKERVELLEALITKDTDFTIPHFSQKKMHLLWGENDRIFNMENAENLKQQLNGRATLHIIEKAGHTVGMERPFYYTTLLSNILSSICDN
ncbi:alpha/beta-Hydrolases superfamily protein [Euphorbia peplus]|nr:alpha/beta-Hydrolases superfamily protein [Euphorbia peplus]